MLHALARDDGITYAVRLICDEELGTAVRRGYASPSHWRISLALSWTALSHASTDSCIAPDTHPVQCNTGSSPQSVLWLVSYCRYSSIALDAILLSLIPDRGSTHLWNVGRQSFYTAVYPRRQLWTSYSPPWELEISQDTVKYSCANQVISKRSNCLSGLNLCLKKTREINMVSNPTTVKPFEA
jgi:hypothetical protein